MFLAVVLSLCAAQFGAFAAAPARGNARGANSANATTQQTGGSPVAARAGARQKVVSNTATAAKQTPAANVTGNTSARAGKKQAVVNNPSAAKPNGARAASTQKVINNGTKVATAATNTVIPQECQDAFYGCMDSFCMLDNASGGRCQCSDRNAELMKVMDDIAKLDEQSYAMATEGVERIQMGENADTIIANAKAAAEKVSNKETAEDNKKKARTLDLSAWNNNVFDEAEDLFDEAVVDTSAVSNALDKTGNALYGSSAKMCLSQMPSQCSNHLTMLQSFYAQKIKSDCMAFENSLKQQKIASTQKLQTAEKALRDASLEKFQEDNKYGLGDCVKHYSQCMENECGSDYSKCITFSAEENIKNAANGTTTKSKKNSKTTISGLVDITVSSSTMTQLLGKKTICDDEVLKYCKKVQDQVWDKYLANVGTTLKSAEINAEDILRQNCIKDLATCFQNSCAAQFDASKDEASYDMCLSDPLLVVDACKIKLDACIVVTGGQEIKGNSRTAMESALSGSRLWTGVTSMLAGMRVDACTKEVKSGIEAICGEDFAHCVGLNPGTIAELLPTDTVTACKEKNSNDKDKVLQYIAEVAQGYALQINDAMYKVCEKAAKDAMVKVCGNADTCDTLNLGNMTFDGLLTVELCNVNKENECKKSVNDFEAKDIVMGYVRPTIKNRININNIVFNGPNASDKSLTPQTYDNNFGYVDTLSATKGRIRKGGGSKNANVPDNFIDPNSPEVKNIISGLNNVFKNKVNVMLNTKVVHDCMYGKKVTGFKKSDEKDDSGKLMLVDEQGKSTRDTNTISNEEETMDRAYAHLLDEYVTIMASKTLELLREKYDKAEQDLQPQIDALNAEISERLTSIEGVEMDKVHETNEVSCLAYAETNNTRDGFSSVQDDDLFRHGCSAVARRSPHFFSTAAYDRGTLTCTVTRTEYPCENISSGCCWGWNETGIPETTTYTMPGLNKEKVIQDAKYDKLLKDN